MEVDTSKWHGYGRGDITLNVGPFPGRKQIAIYAMRGACVVGVAYFPREEWAVKVLSVIDELMGNVDG